MMYPTYGSPDYAAIELRARQLRSQAIAQLGNDLAAWLIAKLSALLTSVTTMRQGMQRGRNQGFFEAQ
jgi:hypothetical protein